MLYYRVVFRIKVYGAENIPQSGGAVLCSNHLYFHDPLIYASHFKRPLYFLAKKEMFEKPLFSWVLKKIHCVPVDRQKTDTNAYKKAVNILKENKLLCIFAHGTRVKENESVAAKSGAVLFAIKGNVPVIPVAVKYNFKKLKNVIVNIGEPLNVADHTGGRLNSEALNSITDLVMEKINNLYVAQQ